MTAGLRHRIGASGPQTATQRRGVTMPFYRDGKVKALAMPMLRAAETAGFIGSEPQRWDAAIKQNNIVVE
jgi:hypothetical protein